MDEREFCAVCADHIDFVAYGHCGHKEVCSNCVVRLRFICKDKKCCICKTESDVVFVTKNVGEYTQRIDLSALLSLDKKAPAPLSLNGKKIYHHEESQAYFEDKPHFDEIMEICKLSCIVCEKDESCNKKRIRFRNPDKLRQHIFEEHELLMCSWCLQGRRKFIHEHKLFTRDELKMHIEIGEDEEGFSGHPKCNLCKKQFYSELELCSHMPTQHFSCHICHQRNPDEEVEYFNVYSDLELHFNTLHYLCGDKGCLAKKYIVFSSDFDLKRHMAKEHGGTACSAVPTGFRPQPRYTNRRRVEDDGATEEEVAPPPVPVLTEAYEFPPLPNAPKKIIQEEKEGNENTYTRTMAGKIQGNKFESARPELFPSLSETFARGSSSSGSTNQPEVSAPANRSWLAPGIPTTRRFGVVGRKAANPNPNPNPKPTKEDLQSAMKSSVLKQIKAGLDSDEGKFSGFNEKSSEYNSGAIDADDYLSYLEKSRLLHLVFEVVRLCSDSQKQRQLLDAYNANQKGKKGKGAMW